MEGQNSRFKLVTGYLAGLFACVAYSFGCAFSQALQEKVPGCQLSVARYLIQFTLYSFLVIITRINISIPRQTVPSIFYYSFLCVVYTIGYFGATGYFPLLEVTGISLIMIIIAVMVHCKIMAKKDITCLNLISLFICSVGIILVSQPHFLFHNNNTHADSQNQTSDLTFTNNVNHNVNSHIVIAYVLLVIGSIADGMVFDVTGNLLSDVTPLVKVLHGSGYGLIASIILTFYLEAIVTDLTLKEVFLVVGHGTATAVGFLAFNYSCHTIGGIRTSLVYSLQVIVMLILQYTIMKSIMPGNHNWVEVIGAIILLLGVTLQPIQDALREYNDVDSIP